MPRDDDEFDERVDALDRFERTLDVQLGLLSDIDTKASNVVRYTSVLIGVVFAALSLVSRSAVASLQNVGTVPRISFFAGISSLVLAICAATITYLSSVQEYGPDPSYGDNVADGAVETPNYEAILLAGYADAVRTNRTVIRVNAQRFRWSLAGLMTGIIYSSLSGGLVALNASVVVELGLFTIVTVLVVPVLYGIYEEAFLVIDRKYENDD